MNTSESTFRRRSGNMVLLCGLSFAVATVPRAASAQSCTGTGNSGSQAQSQAHQQKDNKKKKGEGDANDLSGAVAFSEAAAREALQRLTDGLQGHNAQLMLSAFDDKTMDGYLNFQNEIDALFQQYDSFRVHFRIDQATTEGEKGVVLVEIQLEEIPPSADAQPVRKDDQVRFEMERGGKRWKIVDLRPRNFFF